MRGTPSLSAHGFYDGLTAYGREPSPAYRCPCFICEDQTVIPRGVIREVCCQRINDDFGQRNCPVAPLGSWAETGRVLTQGEGRPGDRLGGFAEESRPGSSKTERLPLTKSRSRTEDHERPVSLRHSVDQSLDHFSQLRFDLSGLHFRQLDPNAGA